MLIMPVQLEKAHVVFIILQRENLVRLQLSDPCDFTMQDVVPGMGDKKPLEIVICYEDDIETITRLQKAGDLVGLINWLCRGKTVYDGDRKPITRL